MIVKTPLEELIGRLEHLRGLPDADRVVALSGEIDQAKRLLRLERGRSVEAATGPGGTTVVALAARCRVSRGALDQLLGAWRAHNGRKDG